MKKPRTLPSIVFVGTLATIILLAACGTGLWVADSYISFQNEAARVRQIYEKRKRALTKSEVDRAVAYVRTNMARADQRLRAEIRERIEDAVAIARGCEARYGDTMSTREIRGKVLEILGDIRFNGGRGYYYAMDSSGRSLLHPHLPVGRDLSTLRDENGTLFVRTMLADVLANGTAYKEYMWRMPGQGDEPRRKISYLYYYPPLDCVFGTGEYLDHVMARIQEETLHWLVNVRFGENGYLFGSTFQGDPLFTNGEITRGGPNILGLTDPNGVPIIRTQIELAKQPEGGFMEYAWRKLGSSDPVDKVVYVRGIPEWGWVLGTGVYLDEVEEQIAQRQEALWKGMYRPILSVLLLAASLVLLGLAASLLLSRWVRGQVDVLHRFFERAFDDVTEVDTQLLPLQEFKSLAESANRMVRRQRQAETALRQSEERYALVISGTNDGIWDWDRETGEVFFSRRWKAILGYGEHEFPNSLDAWKEHIHPDDRDRVLDANNACFTDPGKDRFHAEYRLRRKDGSYCWVLGRGVCLRDTGGVPYRMAGAHTDMTERRQAEEELRSLRNSLSLIIDSMPSVLVGVGPDGRVTQWNLAAEKATGLSAVRARGLALDQAFPRLALEMERVREALETGEVRASSGRTRLVDEILRYEDITVFPLMGEDGPAGAVIRLDDVTDRVRMEKMMVQSEKMLSVGGLAAGMAHEINNPLASVLGFTHNIRKRLSEGLKRNHDVAEDLGVPLDKIQEYAQQRNIMEMLDGIHESGTRAARIVSNMLNFTRKSGQPMRPHDVAAIVESTLSLASKNFDLSRKQDFRQIEIVRDYATNLPKALCEGSEIQQVLLNLFRNGAEAMAEKTYDQEGPRFTVRIQTRNGYVAVEVEDNGPGMPDDVRRRVFEPFFTTKTVGEGTGLGLSVSYFIITQQHGGRMDVESEPGEGTRFTIELPVAQEKENGQ